MTVHRRGPPLKEKPAGGEPAGLFVNRYRLAAHLNGPHSPSIRRHEGLSDHIAAAAVTAITIGIVGIPVAVVPAVIAEAEARQSGAVVTAIAASTPSASVETTTAEAMASIKSATSMASATTTEASAAASRSAGR